MSKRDAKICSLEESLQSKDIELGDFAERLVRCRLNFYSASAKNFIGFVFIERTTFEFANSVVCFF